MLGTQSAREIIVPLSDEEITFSGVDRQVAEEVSHECQVQLSESISSLACSRYVNVGLSELRLVFYASYDLKVHMAQGKMGSCRR